MNLCVEHELCSGHGRCYAVAPTIYDSDDEGYNAARGQVVEVAVGDESAAKQGMRACPENAIRPVRSALQRGERPA